MATGSPYAAQPPQPPVQKSNTFLIVAIVLGAVLGTMLICGGVLVALLLPAVQAARQAARQVQSSNNLKQIGLALHNYHDTFGSLPPAYTTDANGQPLLSWRVALLPFLEEQQLYDQFHFDEPWNSEHNRQLADQMPPIYQSALSDAPATSNEANYFTVRDPNSLFPGAQPVAFDEVPDGIADTAAVVEISTMGVPWSAPDDVTTDEALAAWSQLTPSDAGQVLLADGRVELMRDADEATLRTLIIRNDAQQP